MAKIFINHELENLLIRALAEWFVYLSIQLQKDNLCFAVNTR